LYIYKNFIEFNATIIDEYKGNTIYKKPI